MILFAGCKKEDPEQVADGLGPVTKEYTCECGAKYSVTCKNPDVIGGSGGVALTDPTGGISIVWTYVTDPRGLSWIVKDAAGENVPHYEEISSYKMYFICKNEGCEKQSREFTIEEFKTQTATLPLP